MKALPRRYLNIGVHLLGWCLLGFLLLFYFPLSWDIVVPTFFWLWQSIVLVMMFVLFYVNANIIVPATIIREKASLFFIWILIALFLTQLAAYSYTTYTDMHHRLSELLGNRPRKYQLFDNFVFTISLLVLALSTGWSMLMYWQQAAQREKALEKDKSDTELALLKMQINPHFFFNSLNSVYSLTYLNVEDSRKALLTLSRMMRHLLYSTEGENTTLSLEIDFLKDYVSVMRLRATDRVNVMLDIRETSEDYPIAPMLLLPFVENAFKHGIDATQKTEIIIRLWQEESTLHLNVVNGICAPATNEHGEGGVGLSNTMRRLQLLYPEKHELSNGVNVDGNYEVNLKIDLEP